MNFTNCLCLIICECMLLSCPVRFSEWIHTLQFTLNVKELLDQSRRQVWVSKCEFTLRLVRDMIITYSQMHRTDKYSQHSSIFWPVWLNGWVFVYELSGCGFESRCCHWFSVLKHFNTARSKYVPGGKMFENTKTKYVPMVKMFQYPQIVYYLLEVHKKYRK